MIADLRADSARWRQEQRATGTRGSSSPSVKSLTGITVPDSITESYVGSHTYRESAASGGAGTSATTTSRRDRDRRDNDSPTVDIPPYGAPPPTRGGRDREPARRVDDDRMDLDLPTAAAARRGGYPPDRGDYNGSSRRPDYPVDPRGYPADSRAAYQPQQPAGYGRDARPPVSSPYAQDPRYATAGYQQSNDGAPPGYVRQGDYYVPISAAAGVAMPPARVDPLQYAPNPYGQQAPPPGRDPRDPRGDPRADPRGDPRDPRDIRDPRDPRYAPQQDYQDPRYAYPSPAATVSSVNPIASPPAPRFAVHKSPSALDTANSYSYGSSVPYQTDPYGRRKYY